MRRLPPGAVAAAVTLAAGLGLPRSARAQAPTDLGILRTPPSPAFALMGGAPASVERPGTVRAFAATLLSASGGLTRLPESFSVDVGPYWLTPRPALTFDEFYRPGPRAALLHTLSVSAATSPMEVLEGTGSPGTLVGIGARASPIVGRASSALDAILDSLDTMQEITLDLLQERERAADPAERERIERALTANEETLRALALRMAGAHVQERVGFSLDLAAAALAAVPGDVVDRTRMRSVGVWATGSWRGDGTPLEALALARLVVGTSDPEQDVADLGGRVIVHARELAISLEVVSRIALGGDAPPGADAPAYRSGNRVAGIVEYDLGDAGYLFATFGRGHPSSADGEERLLALFGVNLGFGERPRLVR